MGIAARLRDWLQISAIKPFEEDAANAGGLKAELLLKDLLGAQFRHQNAHLLARRRIPSRQQGRRREIDLIVCDPQTIHLMEVKNWSGQLTVQGGVWRQTRRDGQMIQHPNPIEANRSKRDAVVEYLRDCGLSLSDDFVRRHIVSNLVFWNRHLELDPSVEAMSGVITWRNLEAHFQQPQQHTSLAHQLFSSLLHFCLGSQQKSALEIPPALYEQIVTCLSKTGTWDQLCLYGTKTIPGDLVGLRVGPKSYRREELVGLSKQAPLLFRWTRTRLAGFLKVVTGLGSLGTLYLGRQRLLISPSDTVTFHPVGEETSSTRSLAEVDRIVFG